MKSVRSVKWLEMEARYLSLEGHLHNGMKGFTGEK